MTTGLLRFTLLPGSFAVCRFDPKAPVPQWVDAGPFVSITRTGDELSIICLEGNVPGGTVAATGWACLKLEGPYDFSVSGLVASFSTTLARAGIGLMVVCTYDTDYLLVRRTDLDRSIAELRTSGCTIER